MTNDRTTISQATMPAAGLQWVYTPTPVAPMLAMFKVTYPSAQREAVRVVEWVEATDYRQAVRKIAGKAPRGWSGIRAFNPDGSRAY